MSKPCKQCGWDRGHAVTCDWYRGWDGTDRRTHEAADRAEALEAECRRLRELANSWYHRLSYWTIDDEAMGAVGNAKRALEELRAALTPPEAQPRYRCAGCGAHVDSGDVCGETHVVGVPDGHGGVEPQPCGPVAPEAGMEGVERVASAALEGAKDE